MRQTNAEKLRRSVEALDNIAGEIESLILQAGRLLAADPATEEVWGQARTQWYATILSSIHEHSEWVGGPRTKMATSIDRLLELAEEEEWMENKGRFYEEPVAVE